MYIYNLNKSGKIIVDKKTTIKINLLMYGRHGILSILLQSIKGYLVCAKKGNFSLQECYFEIICTQVSHLITLQNAMGDRVFFLSYESNTWAGFDKNYKCEKKLIADSLVEHRLLLKNYKKVIKENENQNLDLILRKNIKQNQLGILNLKLKSSEKRLLFT